MSQVLINKYLTELAHLRKISGTHRESVVREAFKDLLKDWGRAFDLTFVPEYELETKTKERRYVDGALLHTLRVPFGYWEAKDEKDDIDAEIETKFRRGYPKSNIIFEDSRQAVLIQNSSETMRCDVSDVESLEKLLRLFFGYQRPEIEAFRKAVEQFAIDLPAVLGAMRAMIDNSHTRVPEFRLAAGAFLTHARDAINPSLTDADVREMLIQHILTGEVFAAVFPDTGYHEDNSIARELHKLESTFFTGNTKHQTLKALAPYYGAIRRAATEISGHHEKQSFLKAVYENFYRVYNPKAADRLGVVYTPSEIVRFMIQGTDWLCEKHFGRSLIDRDVDILDPATGTGTFVAELIEYFAGQPSKLERKYRHELHANEVAILPYYVANLNIEATYASVVGTYEEFPGLCFVDTLDNTSALRKHKGHIDDLFGSVSDDNVKRIRRQNSKRISVVIGNPPYNANQVNENENNKNREYPEIDDRIRRTYIAESTAKKTKLYDMYARFFRWAADRLDQNGILALVTNRSFIDGRTYDGFRACAAKEFNEIYLVDLGGDVRTNPKLSGTTHNVFGIQIGVAISFMVRKEKRKDCKIHYARRPEMERAAEKLAFLGSSKLSEISFDVVSPDKQNYWIREEAGDFESYIPIARKSSRKSGERADSGSLFKSCSLGVSTNRDDWLYDYDKNNLKAKVQYLLRSVGTHAGRSGEFGTDIKWSETLKRRAVAGVSEPFDDERIRPAAYRPFVTSLLYQSQLLIDRPGALSPSLASRAALPNRWIVFTDPTAQKPWLVSAVRHVPDLHYVGAAAGAVCVPEFIESDGQRTESVSDWALSKFRAHYRSELGKSAKPISKEDLFHYVYAVLHDPAYRTQFSSNLKRELPRVPFYRDFAAWSSWGRRLIELHTEYETATPFGFERVEKEGASPHSLGRSPKALLRANRDGGTIVVDSETILKGVPPAAWRYQLGSRCALEWILDQYKEKACRDPTVRERFDSYRFADYKDRVIDLLARVTTVSVETVKILEQMDVASR